MRSARAAAENPPSSKTPREDFHLAGAIYIQSGHCDFISQMMLQAKVYCVPLCASNCLKPTFQFQQRRPAKDCRSNGLQS